jgi:formylglycine-generating enzyme required for sulfatase activity
VAAGPTRPAPRRRRRWLVLGGIALVLLAGLFAAALLSWGGGRTGGAGPPITSPQQLPEGRAAAPKKLAPQPVAPGLIVQAAELPKEVTNFIGMKLVLIPAGKFTMGSPEDEKNRSDDEQQHEVEISKPFYMGVYEVTQGEYEKVMGTNPSWFSATGGGKEKVEGKDTSRFPVEKVSWNDAVEFCKKLSEMPEEKRNGPMYRLPTEAEWEYACRGGASVKPFHFGDSLSSTQANFDGNYPYGGADKGPYLERTTRVGSYDANAFGLYDMHGNVWEWCADWYDKDYYKTSPRKDPPGPATGTYRVLRGGSWGSFGRGCRAAYRSFGGPGYRVSYLGFRVVLVAGARTP